ncbi:MAG: radical SAM protein [Bacteroidales bacterium]|nr:radical SAM protein [Bacteroidales bacterium]
MLSDYIRKRISRYFTHQDEITFLNKPPSIDDIERNFNEIYETGLYLHIPFCERICPYCPYNKEIYNEQLCMEYVKNIMVEIDTYASMLKNKPVTTFYIGGGTPTTMLGKGLEQILNHIYKRFSMHCDIHLESHPNHLTAENLNYIEALGVKYLSIGVEALQDHHLKAIKRPYTVNEAKKSIERAVNLGFKCVNIDYIFDLPGQTKKEIEDAANEIVNMGVHQVATYPLFRFDYTRMGAEFKSNRGSVSTMFRRRKFLKIFEDILYDQDFYRSSVWAFTKNGTDKYCSVTVPLYLGLGASGSSYLKDIFYVNTFSVAEYNKAIQQGRLPIALSIELLNEMQMAGWLYWRIYETRFRKSDFKNRFDLPFDEKYGKQMNWLRRMGYLKNGSDDITLTDRGAYWIHAFEDYFSINYINKLWGTSKNNPWPEKVVL